MPEETTLTKQGVWLYIEIVTCNGWYAGVERRGDWGDVGGGERLLSKISPTFS